MRLALLLALLQTSPPPLTLSASVGSITSGGVYTAPTTARGTATITATAGGVTLTVPVTFVAPDLVGAFAVGMSQYPVSNYCASPFSAFMQPVEPSDVLSVIRSAAACGKRVVLVPKRKLLTSTGTTSGLFLLANAKAATDGFARVLPFDTLAKYQRTIIGFNLTDDYTCASCWGGTLITPAEIEAWAVYTRPRLPNVPLGIRVLPSWATTTLASRIDYAWAQYHTGRGDAQTWYDRAAADAKAKGLKLVMGVNLENCGGSNTPPCTAAQLREFGGIAVNHPASCAFVSWMYDATTWAQADIKLAWADLTAQGALRLPQECRK